MTRVGALNRLARAVAARREAEREYQQAILECVAEGISNIRMGSTAGISETAIRMYRKRHNLYGSK